MAKQRCKFGVNKRTKACLKGPRRKKGAKKARPRIGAKGGRYCVTVTTPGRGKKPLAFKTICHSSKAKALADLERRSVNAYTAMIHRPGKKRAR